MKSFVLLAIAGVCAAQDQIDPAAPPILKAFAERKPAEIQALSFAGGSLTEFANAVVQAHAANIVLSKLAEGAEVPAMELKQTSVEAALRTACRTVRDPYRADLEVTPSLDPETKRPTGKPIYHVRVDRPPQGNKASVTAHTAPPEVRVFSLRFLTSADAGPATPVNSVLTAIDTGLGMVAETAPAGPAPAKATVRFHADSNLLFVAGSPAQLDVVQQVLMRLEGDRAQALRPAQANSKDPVAKPKEPGGEPTKATGIR